MWTMFDLGPAGVFAEAHVADPVQAILDPPVTAIVRQQLSRGGPFRGEAGDGVGRLPRFAGPGSSLLNGNRCDL